MNMVTVSDMENHARFGWPVPAGARAAATARCCPPGSAAATCSYITQNEKKALQFAGKVFLELSAEALSKALRSGVLWEGGAW
jgi:hypothetical protein